MKIITKIKEILDVFHPRHTGTSFALFLKDDHLGNAGQTPRMLHQLLGNRACLKVYALLGVLWMGTGLILVNNELLGSAGLMMAVFLSFWLNSVNALTPNHYPPGNEQAALLHTQLRDFFYRNPDWKPEIDEVIEKIAQGQKNTWWCKQVQNFLKTMPFAKNMPYPLERAEPAQDSHIFEVMINDKKDPPELSKSFDLDIEGEPRHFRHDQHI